MAHVNMSMLCYHYSKQQNKSACVSVIINQVSTQFHDIKPTLTHV